MLFDLDVFMGVRAEMSWLWYRVRAAEEVYDEELQDAWLGWIDGVVKQLMEREISDTSGST